MTVRNPIPAEEIAKTPEPVISEREWPQTRTIVRMLFIVLAAATALWVLHALRGVLFLAVLAIFFAYLVAPLVKLVHRPFTMRGRERNTPRAMAIGIVYLGIFGSIGIALVLLLPRLSEQITQFANQVPTYLVTTRGRAQKLNDLYQRYQLPPTVRDAINDTVTRGIATSEEYLTAEMANAIGWIVYLPWLVLIPVFAFFLLRDADAFRHSALQILPKGRLRWRGDEFGHGIHLHPFAIILAVLCGAELAGIAGIFLAIPMVAILSVGYRHWLEHRGSDGLVAELLAPRAAAEPAFSDSVQPAPTG